VDSFSEILANIYQSTWYHFLKHLNLQSYASWSDTLHLPQATLAICQKGAYYLGVEVFNSFPTALQDIYSEPGQFKIALRNFLEIHSFYSLDEYFDKQ
jgi:hypothetical protein